MRVGVSTGQTLLTAYNSCCAAPDSQTGYAKGEANKSPQRQGIEEVDALREGRVYLDGLGGCARTNVPFLRALVVAHVPGATADSSAALGL